MTLWKIREPVNTVPILAHITGLPEQSLSIVEVRTTFRDLLPGYEGVELDEWHIPCVVLPSEFHDTVTEWYRRQGFRVFADLCALDPEWDLETVHVIDPYFYSGPRDTGIGAVIEAFEEEESVLKKMKGLTVSLRGQSSSDGSE